MNKAHVKLPTQFYQQMLTSVRKGYPYESCGYFAGCWDQEQFTVRKHYSLYNVDQSEEHFSMDPKEQMATYQDASQEGLALGICYHSHPHTEARPSVEDIRLAYDPHMIYAICSLRLEQPRLEFYRIIKMDSENSSSRIWEGEMPQEVVDFRSIHLKDDHNGDLYRYDIYRVTWEEISYDTETIL